MDSYTGGDVCYIEAKFTNTDHFYRSFEGDVSQNRVWDNGTFKNGEYVAVWVNIPKDIASGTYKIEVKASNSSTNNDDNAETATAYMFIKVKNDSYDKLPALTGNAITDLVAIATSQIGYTETASDITKYGEWYGLQDDWCAMFISWCANKANIDTNVIPKTAGAGTFRSVGTQHKVWGADFDSEADDVEYIPKKGDIVLLMPYNESTKKYYNAYTPTSHVGIVSQDAYKDSNGDIIINTIECVYV